MKIIKDEKTIAKKLDAREIDYAKLPVFFKDPDNGWVFTGQTNRIYTIEELNEYIQARINEKYRGQTFVPVKVNINDSDLSIDIKLMPVSTVDVDNNRYKLDLSSLSKEGSTCKNIKTPL